MAEEKSLVFVDYNMVEKNHGDRARGVYKEIATIAGGDPSPHHEGGISLVGLPDAKTARIAKLLEKPEEKEAEKAPEKEPAVTPAKTTPAKNK